MTPEQLLNTLTAVAAFLCLAVCWSIQKQGRRMIRKANEGNPLPTTSDTQTPIYEKDGKYFQEIQVPWSEATLEERERWACYQQTHVKRMVEVKKEDLKS